jgi:hypothetical protein
LHGSAAFSRAFLRTSGLLVYSLVFLDLCEDDRCDNIVPWGIHNTSQCLGLQYLYFVHVACGCTPPELDAMRPDGFYARKWRFV